jgi:hypothetical protein
MRPLTRRLRLENLESRRLLAAVNIPDDLVGQVGAEVAAPVVIDSAQGVRGAEIRIKYDPTLLTLTSEDVTAGSAWESVEDTQVVANVDQATGTVVVFISASAGLPDVEGSLVIFAFAVRDQAAPGTETPIDLVEVKLNEGTIPVNPAPIAGPDPTDGSILISDQPGETDRIAGFVFADTNNDNLPGALEGIPGVTITLINIETGAQRQTTSDDQGAFEFTQVAAGRYRVVQTQPLAYLEGGPNELTVDLAAGQNLENQNFRELGLRAAYVYNRLFTTTALPIGSPPWIEVLRQINMDAAGDSAAPASSTPSTTDQADDESAAATSESDLVAEGESDTSVASLMSSSTLADPDSQPEGESELLASADELHSEMQYCVPQTAQSSYDETQPTNDHHFGPAATPYLEPEQDQEAADPRSVDEVLAKSELW